MNVDKSLGRSEASPGRARSFPWDERPIPAPRSLAEPLVETHHNPQILWQNQKLESLGRLAGGVTHDFNNYLLAILGNADLMNQDLDPQSAHGRLVAEIQLAARRASDLCSQLSAFAGKGHFRLEPVDLTVTVSEMLAMLKAALSRRIGLCLELSADRPVIAGDSSRLQQVVMNLAVNAAEAIGDRQGTVTLRTDICRVEQCRVGQWVLAPVPGAEPLGLLSVTDTGPGMTRATIARVFDPFYSTKPQGRGLGLASVLGIMRAHHGGVGVDSTLGKGTTMTVAAPLRGMGTPRAATVPRTRVRPPGGTVLVVDDEEYLRVLSRRMLGRLGYEVHVAESGRAALEMCRRLRPSLDCVLLDLIMPEMDGQEVYAELHRLYPDLRVLLTSGYHEAEVSRRFAGQGLAGFLQKPYVLEDLAAKLDAVLRSPTGAPPPAS